MALDEGEVEDRAYTYDFLVIDKDANMRSSPSFKGARNL